MYTKRYVEQSGFIRQMQTTVRKTHPRSQQTLTGEAMYTKRYMEHCAFYMTAANHVLDHVIKLLDQYIELAAHGTMLFCLNGCLFITALCVLTAASLVLTKDRKCQSIG